MNNFPIEFKASAVGSDGGFSGYAAIFNNVDSGGDIIRPSAFQEFVKTRDGKTLILYQHSQRDPIGKATVTQDSKGLAFSGQLELADPTAAKAHILMKRGLIDGMSVGYDVLPGGARLLQDGTRELTALKLFEISPVVWGMNVLAHIESVKSLAACTDERELKHLLHHEHKFSRTRAAAIADSILRGKDTPDGVDPENLIEFFKNISKR